MNNNYIFNSKCETVDCYKCPLNNLCKVARMGYDKINHNTQSTLNIQLRMYEDWIQELRIELKKIKDDKSN